MAMAMAMAGAGRVRAQVSRGFYASVPYPPCPKPKAKRKSAEAVSASTAPPPLTPNVFVSGLSDSTTTKSLLEAFSKFGLIRYVELKTDLYNKYPLGFGFIRYSTVEEAAKSVKAMNGKIVDGAKISADFAKPISPSQLRSSVELWRWTEDLST